MEKINEKIIEFRSSVINWSQQTIKCSVEHNQIVLKSDVDQLDAQNFSLHYMLIQFIVYLSRYLLSF